MKQFSFLGLFLIVAHFAASQEKKSAVHSITEAKIEVSLPDEWELLDKAGDLEDGMMQYFFRRAPIKANGKDVYPASIFVLDKLQNRSLQDFHNERIRSHQSNGMKLVHVTTSHEDKGIPAGALLTFMRMEKTEIPVKTYFIHIIHNQLAIEIILNNSLESNVVDQEIQAIKESLKLM